mmetsp:Transcript_86345/g.279580  ORF Transcript_86345/g.279580 Transcript_86345/m.279580 type:complete len:228 (-) Transcript_86345:189-872(-)
MGPLRPLVALVPDSLQSHESALPEEVPGQDLPLRGGLRHVPRIEQQARRGDGPIPRGPVHPHRGRGQPQAAALGRGPSSPAAGPVSSAGPDGSQGSLPARAALGRLLSVLRAALPAACQALLACPEAGSQAEARDERQGLLRRCGRPLRRGRGSPVALARRSDRASDQPGHREAVPRAASHASPVRGRQPGDARRLRAPGASPLAHHRLGRGPVAALLGPTSVDRGP